MSLNISPFNAATPTIATSVGGAAGAKTVTIGTSATGLPYNACRIACLGTATLYVQFISTNNTVTVGVTNSQPILSNQIQNLGTGGQPAIGLITAGTFTVTALITPGVGRQIGA